jgi:hypothetical protein
LTGAKKLCNDLIIVWVFMLMNLSVAGIFFPTVFADEFFGIGVDFVRNLMKLKRFNILSLFPVSNPFLLFCQKIKCKQWSLKKIKI